jgi:hypothetical protein
MAERNVFLKCRLVLIHKCRDLNKRSHNFIICVMWSEKINFELLQQNNEKGVLICEGNNRRVAKII